MSQTGRGEKPYDVNEGSETSSRKIYADNMEDDGLDEKCESQLLENDISEATPLFSNPQKYKKQSPTCSMYILTFFAALGGFLFGYDTGVISGALLPLSRLFHLNDVWREVIVSATVGAAIFGAVSGGWFNDKFGRKLVLIASSVIFTAGAVIMAVASRKEVLLIGRLIVGVAIGKNKKKSIIEIRKYKFRVMQCHSGFIKVCWQDLCSLGSGETRMQSMAMAHLR